jgi:predicted RNase H-like HicB family nuclease
MMDTVKIIYWEEDGGWIGYLDEYPDYWTQGGTLDDLRDHLKDLHQDLTGGVLPAVRRRGELVIP